MIDWSAPLVDWLPSIAVGGAAGFLFLRGFFHAGALARIIFDSERKLRESTPTPPPPKPRFDADAHELAIWQETGVWWLDPNRWGEVPYSKPVHGKAHVRVVDLMGLCPNCEVPMEPMATYAGKAHVWDCRGCGTTWKLGRHDMLVRKSAPDKLPCGCYYETKVVSRAYPTGGFDMGRYAECQDCKATWDYAPKYSDEGDVRRMIRGEVDRENCRKLPCGCDYNTPVHERASPGDRTSTCLHCGNWWRPPSNQPNPRLLAQGSAVHVYPDNPENSTL